MTGLDLLERVRARGGELRLMGTRLQYRPPDVLDHHELAWLSWHRVEVVQDLDLIERLFDALPEGPAIGVAGPSVPAWHRRIAIPPAGGLRHRRRFAPWERAVR